MLLYFVYWIPLYCMLDVGTPGLTVFQNVQYANDEFPKFVQGLPICVQLCVSHDAMDHCVYSRGGNDWSQVPR